MKVKAIGKNPGMVVGIHNNSRVRSGDVFSIDEKDFNKDWMEKVTEEVVSPVLTEDVPVVKPQKTKNVLG